MFLFFFSGFVNADPYSNVSDEELAKIREKFFAAVSSESVFEELKQYFDENYSEDKNLPALVLAYKGGTISLNAKYSPFPITKFVNVKKSLNLLDRAIMRAPENLEIRFIRFSILNNVPGIMGYGNERKEDAEIIIESLLENDYSYIDQNLQQKFTQYMLDTDRLTDEQITRLKNNIIVLNE